MILFMLRLIDQKGSDINILDFQLRTMNSKEAYVILRDIINRLENADNLQIKTLHSVLSASNIFYDIDISPIGDDYYKSAIYIKFTVQSETVDLRISIWELSDQNLKNLRI